MFRTALLRSARSSAARAVQRATPIARPAARTSFAATPRFTPIAFQAVRCYSAGGALNQDEVYGRIFEILKNFDKVKNADDITPTATFTNDLGLDSLDTVEVVMAIEEEFSIEIPDKDADTITSVEKAANYILAQPDAH